MSIPPFQPYAASARIQRPVSAPAFGGLVRKGGQHESAIYTDLPLVLLEVIPQKRRDPVEEAIKKHFKNDRITLEEDVRWLLQSLVLKDLALPRREPQQIDRLVTHYLPRFLELAGSRDSFLLIAMVLSDSAKDKKLGPTMAKLEQLLTAKPDNKPLIRLLAERWQQHTSDKEKAPQWFSALLDMVDLHAEITPARLQFFQEMTAGSDTFHLYQADSDKMRLLLLFLQVYMDDAAWLEIARQVKAEGSWNKRCQMMKDAVTYRTFQQ